MQYGYFEQFGEGTARMYRFIEVALQWVYSLTANTIKGIVGSPARVLEIGPGTGVLTNKLSKLGYYVVGVDVSLAMLRRAQGRFWRPDFVNGGSWALPIGVSKFDAVVAVFTLHHWGDHELSMSNVVKSLRPNASFIVVEVDGDRLNAHGHSCTSKCLTDVLTPYFNDVVLRRKFPLIIAIAKSPKAPTP
jgi:SAM-dependent methyltransferase